MEKLFEPIKPEPNNNNMDVLPAGRYTVMITGTKVKTTKSRNGRYAEIEFTVQGKPHEGRKVWGRFTFENPNAQAVNIGKRQMGEIADACGMTEDLFNPQQLQGKRCIIEVVVKDDPQYGKGNEFKKALPITGAPSLTVSQQAAPTPPSSGDPWEQ